jgi:hypothetical protein
MNPMFLISVDLEENWEGPGSTARPDVSNVYEIPGLQKNIFDKLNIRPISLLSRCFFSFFRNMFNYNMMEQKCL